jgi:hypothetical protein
MWRRACVLSLVGSWAILFSACADRPPRAAAQPPREPTAQSPAKPTAQRDADPPVNDERSLTLEEYIEAGLPAHNRVWSGTDMARAAKALAEIAGEDYGRLPRYRGERSGAAFDRLTSVENLEPYGNLDLPIAQRLPDALNHLQSTNQLLLLYVNAINQQGFGGGELVEIMGSILRMTALIFDLTDEFLPTLDKNDPSYPTRLKGLAQMRGGASTTISGCITSLTESPAYSTAELKRLIGYLRETLPDLLPRLDPESALEIQVRLQSFTKDDDLAHLKPDLDALAKDAEKIVPAKSKN